jgi:hypothetical protein
MSAADLLTVAASELAQVRAERNLFRDALEHFSALSVVQISELRAELRSLQGALHAINDMAKFNSDPTYCLPAIRELARKTLEPK